MVSEDSGGLSLRDACLGKTEKLSLTMIDGKPTNGKSAGKKDQDGHGME